MTFVKGIVTYIKVVSMIFVKFNRYYSASHERAFSNIGAAVYFNMSREITTIQKA